MKLIAFYHLCLVWGCIFLQQDFLVSASSRVVVPDHAKTARTIDHFTHLVKQGKYEEAAHQCVAPDASFRSPRFHYKSRSEWLSKFPALAKRAVACYIGPLQAMGERVFARYAKIKLFGIILSVKELIELNHEGKIIRSEIRFA